jgi:ABC-type polysaccharide/polyol phosphate export permease
MQLPELWSHHTARRTWYGRLDDGDASAPSAMVRSHRRAELARSIQVLWVLTRSDFRARYRAQALGVFWSLVSPLVMMAIMSLVFTQVFRTSTDHFPIFLLIGLVVWEWISNAITASTQVFVHNADVIKRTVFARHMLPVAAVLSHGINFLIAASMLLVFVPIFPGAFRLSPALLLVPIFLGLLVMLMVGIGLATSVLNVIYRDVAYLVNTALLLLYWLTPVIYPIDVIPQPYRSILVWNPLGGVLTALRGAIMRGQYPTLSQWAAIAVPTTVILAIGWVIFRRNERLVLDYV